MANLEDDQDDAGEVNKSGKKRRGKPGDAERMAGMREAKRLKALETSSSRWRPGLLGLDQVMELEQERGPGPWRA